MRSWLRIVRPINGVMGMVATVLSVFIAIGYSITMHYEKAIVAAICVFMVTSGGNILNDIYDAETDRINHPERPIPSGQIGIRNARVAFMVLYSVSIALGFTILGLIPGLIVVMAEVLLFLYETRLKGAGLSGNVAIGILVGLIFIFGGITVGAFYKMIILFVMASLTNIGREITKDVQDMGGDKDRRTFPKVYGVRKSMYLTLFLVAVAVAASFLPYVFHIFSFYYLMVVIPSDALFLYSSFLVRRLPRKSQTYSKYAMILGLFSFLVGEVA